MRIDAKSILTEFNLHDPNAELEPLLNFLSSNAGLERVYLNIDVAIRQPNVYENEVKTFGYDLYLEKDLPQIHLRQLTLLSLRCGKLQSIKTLDFYIPRLNKGARLELYCFGASAEELKNIIDKPIAISKLRKLWQSIIVWLK